MNSSPVDIAVQALVGSGSRLSGQAAEAKRLLDRHENVVLYGPPGTGKSYAAQLITARWRSENGPDSVIVTTFHPSYSYEDFVEGFRPDPVNPLTFKLTDGLLLRAAGLAGPGRRTLLVIDEINRADVAKVFGELITYIESDKRNVEFTTAQQPAARRRVPTELYVLGTMNTADKSISLLDVALRRRFKFIECPPDPTAFASSSNWKEYAFGINLGQLLNTINGALLRAGIGRERLVGQALLGLDPVGDDSDLFDRLQYDVFPLIEEYTFSDAERIAEILPGLVDEHGAFDPTGLTIRNIQSWIPSSPVASDQDTDDRSDGDDSDATNAASDGFEE